MGQKVTVFARLKAKEGSEGELKELLLTLIEPSRSDEGCVKYDLHQAIKDPGLFVFYEIWESRDHLDKHARTPHFQQFQNKSKDMLAGPPELILLENISG